MLARVRCLAAAEAGRQLAAQALREQQQERQLSHASASTSAAGSREQDGAAVALLAGAEVARDAAAWRRVEREAQRAVQAWRAAEHASDGAVQQAFEELAWMLALQGSPAAAEQCDQLLRVCLFPAAAEPAADLERAAEAAALEGGRSAGTALHRSALHRQAAEAFAAGGDMVPALYHASEAHRLLAALFHGEHAASAALAPAADDGDERSVGWWRLAAAYLASLLHLGGLFEAAGLADEALHALREGQRLVRAD